MVRNKDVGFFLMSYDKLSKVDHKPQEENWVKMRLDKLKELLQILYSKGILLVDEISISRSHLSLNDIVLRVDDSSELDKISNKLYECLVENDNSGIIGFKGRTIVFEGIAEKKEYNQCFDFYYFLESSSIECNITSDIWLPVDLNDNLQIELAELNSPRLYSCFENIIETFDYDYLYPSKDEEDVIGIVPQKGFKLFLLEDITEREDFPKDKIEVVQKYLWKNR